jgi:hypothetical protein
MTLNYTMSGCFVIVLVGAGLFKLSVGGKDGW